MRREGAWLREGQHLDLVGAYTPQMRESDDRAIARQRTMADYRGDRTGAEICSVRSRSVMSMTVAIGAVSS